MAAPTASKTGVQETIVDKTKQKTKKEVKKQKNVLFNPFPFKWPMVEKYFEGRILDELQSLLESLPLKLPKRPLSYFKGKRSKEEEQTEDEKKKDEERKELRSQIVCGIREVTKGLERNDLDLIIVCRSTQPSIITKHLIPLAGSQSCPALCIPEFNPKIAPLLGVSSLVAFGFKKILPGSQSKFKEFLKYAKSVAPPIDAPWVMNINRTLEDSMESSESPVGDATEDSDNDKRNALEILGEISNSKSVSLSAKDIKASKMSESSKRDDFISLSLDKDTCTLSKESSSSKIVASSTPASVRDSVGGSVSKKSEDFISLSPAGDETHVDQKSAGSLSIRGAKSKDSGFLSLTTESNLTQIEGSSKKAENNDKFTGKPELVFPLDGPPPFVPKSDYSYLYVFKSAGKFGDDFISFGDSKGKKRDLSLISSESESESVEEEVGGILGEDEPVAKKHKFSKASKHPAFRPALIRTQVANPNKKKKKNKSKEK